MACNAVAYGWGQVGEKNLLRLLQPDVVQAVLKALLVKREKSPVSMEVLRGRIYITQGQTQITYDTDGNLQVTINQLGMQGAANQLAAEAISALKKVALLRLKIAVGNVIRGRGGMVLAVEESGGATVMKVEVNNA